VERGGMTERDKQDAVSMGAMTIRQAIEFAGVKRTFLYHCMTDKKLPYIKLGTRRLIPRKALEQFLADHLLQREVH
jgi:excisionase family DNA binding protein